MSEYSKKEETHIFQCIICVTTIISYELTVGGIVMIKCRKIFGAIIASLSIGLCLTAKVDAAYIKDVKESHWASPTIQQYVDNGYVQLEDGCFYPNRSITRGQMADILVKSLRLKVDESVVLEATDMTSQHPSYNALRTLVSIGVLDNSKQLNPDSTLTRGQMAKIIALAFQIEVDNVNKSKFKDYASTYWAKPYIESLADADIIKGKTATRYAPNDSVTRAQFVALASRAKSFTSKVRNLEVAYDLLSKGYIVTKQVNYKMVSEVIDIVNKERSVRGLSILQEDPRLHQLATVKLNDMLQRKYFEHESPYYGYPWEMANYLDYDFRSLGENLAKSLVTPTDVMKGWMTSPTHKENILKANYTHIGVAVKRDQTGNYYWVQLFSSK